MAQNSIEKISQQKPRKIFYSLTRIHWSRNKILISFHFRRWSVDVEFHSVAIHFSKRSEEAAEQKNENVLIPSLDISHISKVILSSRLESQLIYIFYVILALFSFDSSSLFHRMEEVKEKNNIKNYPSPLRHEQEWEKKGEQENVCNISKIIRLQNLVQKEKLIKKSSSVWFQIQIQFFHSFHCLSDTTGQNCINFRFLFMLVECLAGSSRDDAKSSTRKNFKFLAWATRKTTRERSQPDNIMKLWKGKRE